MSYREIRNFIEIMRALGYSRLLSVENFREPNFPLVAEILQWLIKRYDPNQDIPTNLDTEEGRVAFIKTIAQTMLTTVHVKLNTRKLYGADGYAVKELLKVSQLLYDAANQQDTPAEYTDEGPNPYESAINKMSDLKQARQIASEITQRGAQLYDNLHKEEQLRKLRAEVLTKPLEISQIEETLQNALKALQEEIGKTQQMIENVASDEAALETKIEKRQQELERAQGRLENMRAVRPAYMDEYKQLEEQMAKLHEEYAIKFRCLSYLDQKMEEMEQHELEKAKEREEEVKRIVQKRLERERGHLRADSAEDEDSDPDSGIKGEGAKKTSAERPVSRRREQTGRGRVVGSMMGADQGDSDSDLDLGGDTAGNDDRGNTLSESTEDDDDMEMADMGAVRPSNPLRANDNNNNSFSDNDF